MISSVEHDHGFVLMIVEHPMAANPASPLAAPRRRESSRAKRIGRA
jgi:hypothetical protein